MESVIGKNSDENLVKEFREVFNAYWDKIDVRLSSANIHKIYQDTYSDCDSLDKMLQHYRNGVDRSRNFSAICSLVDNGALLMVTESYIAITKSQNSISKLQDSAIKLRSRKRPPKSEVSRRLMPRDRCIAMNIDKTLQKKETGVLFIGFYHNTDKILLKQYPAIRLEILDGYAAKLMKICAILNDNYIKKFSK